MPSTSEMETLQRSSRQTSAAALSTSRRSASPAQSEPSKFYTDLRPAPDPPTRPGRTPILPPAKPKPKQEGAH